MHMSSAFPRGTTPGQPGEYTREYKKMDWILFLWGGENSHHCFRFKKKGWGNSKFCKIADGKVHRDPTVIYLFAHCVVPENIHTPRPSHGRSLEIPRGRGVHEKLLFQRVTKH